MRPRPPYLTVICWIALAGSLLGLWAAAVLTLEPEPAFLGTLETWSYVPWSLVLLFVWLQVLGSGIAAWHMLRHANWARWLYVSLGVLDLLWRYTSVMDRAAFPIAVICYAAIFTALFLPASNDYFSSRSRRARRV